MAGVATIAAAPQPWPASPSLSPAQLDDRSAHHPTRLRPHGGHRARAWRAVGGDRRLGRRRLARRAGRAVSGVSHFLEHLLFKGTPTRTPQEISRSVDRVGGDFNAFTAKEYTAYYCRLPARHVLFGVELLGDVLIRAGAARRRRRQRAPGDPRGAGDGRRLARRRRPPHVRARSCSPTTRSVARRPATARPCRRSPPTDVRRVLRLALPRRRRWSSPSPARSTTTRCCAESSTAFADVRPTGERPGASAPRARSAADDVDRRRHRAGAHRHGRPGPGPRRRATARRSTSSTTSSAAACRAGCSTRSASGAASPTRCTRASRRTPTAGAFQMYAGTQPEHGDEVIDLMRAELERLVTDGITDDELDVADRLPHRRLRARARGHRRAHGPQRRPADHHRLGPPGRRAGRPLGSRRPRRAT